MNHNGNRDILGNHNKTVTSKTDLKSRKRIYHILLSIISKQSFEALKNAFMLAINYYNFQFMEKKWLVLIHS